MDSLFTIYSIRKDKIGSYWNRIE